MNVEIIHFPVILNPVSIGQGLAKDLERVGHGQKSRYYIIFGQKMARVGHSDRLAKIFF